MPSWTDDPVRDAERYDRYLCELEDYDEEEEEERYGISLIASRRD